MVHTNHMAVRFLIYKPTNKMRIIKWLLLLQEFDIEIADYVGKVNVVEFRVQPIMNLWRIDFQMNICLRKLVEKTKSMMKGKNVADYLWADVVCATAYLTNKSPTKAVSGKTPEEAWSGKKHTMNHLKVFGRSLQDTRLLYKSRLFVHPQSSFIPAILTEYHSSPLGGHSGFDKTYHCIHTDFYWPRMKSIIATFIAKCDTCQRQKVENIAQPDLLQPLPIPQGKWKILPWTSSQVTGLPPFTSFDSIWVVIDRLTKYAHFIPVNTSYIAPRLAKIYLQSIF
eukprot:Gb_27013 [translate_table: standard]